MPNEISHHVPVNLRALSVGAGAEAWDLAPCLCYFSALAPTQKEKKINYFVFVLSLLYKTIRVLKMLCKEESTYVVITGQNSMLVIKQPQASTGSLLNILDSPLCLPGNGFCHPYQKGPAMTHFG